MIDVVQAGEDDLVQLGLATVRNQFERGGPHERVVVAAPAGQDVDRQGAGASERAHRRGPYDGVDIGKQRGCRLQVTHVPRQRGLPPSRGLLG